MRQCWRNIYIYIYIYIYWIVQTDYIICQVGNGITKPIRNAVLP
ncbi:hypothetical protein ACMBCM_08685 [Spiroplasma sp. K1]